MNTAGASTNRHERGLAVTGFSIDVHQQVGVSKKPLGSQVMSPVGTWAEPDEWDKAEATCMFEDENERRLDDEELWRLDQLERYRH